MTTPRHATAHFDVRIGFDGVISVNVSRFGPEAFMLHDIRNEAARRLGGTPDKAPQYETVEQANAVADLAECLYGEGWRP